MVNRLEEWQTLENQIVTCNECPRLVAWRELVAERKRRAYMDWEYWGKPVPGFGDTNARVLVVGLAPGAHGANRTGRMFTGDGSGEFLYGALHRAGFANQPEAIQRGDDLALLDLFISAVCRCAPPGNKPTPQEINNCLPYLENELNLLTRLEGIVCLGRIAFDTTIRLFRWKWNAKPGLKFAHGAFSALGDGLPWVLASYHPSRQNTQTGRLTQAMFDEVWEQVRSLI